MTELEQLRERVQRLERENAILIADMELVTQCDVALERERDEYKAQRDRAWVVIDASISTDGEEGIPISEQMAERDALIAALRGALEQWTCYICGGEGYHWWPTGTGEGDTERRQCPRCRGKKLHPVATAALVLTPTTASELAAAERRVVEVALALKRADDAAQEAATVAECEQRKAEYDEAVEDVLQAAERLAALKAKEVGDAGR